MIKAKVINSFYYAKDKELYLDEDRFKELKELGLVEPIEQVVIMQIDETIGIKEMPIEQATINKKIKK